VLEEVLNGTKRHNTIIVKASLTPTTKKDGLRVRVTVDNAGFQQIFPFFLLSDIQKPIRNAF